MNQQIFPIIIVISKVIFFFRTIALVDITKLSPWLEEVAVVVCGGGGGGCNDFFINGIRSSEGLFLMSTQNYFLFYARDKTEKHLCLVHYRAQIKLSYRSIELMFTDAK